MRACAAASPLLMNFTVPAAGVGGAESLPQAARTPAKAKPRTATLAARNTSRRLALCLGPPASSDISGISALLTHPPISPMHGVASHRLVLDIVAAAPRSASFLDHPAYRPAPKKCRHYQREGETKILPSRPLSRRGNHCNLTLRQREQVSEWQHSTRSAQHHVYQIIAFANK